jgi:putative heme-binding domain-containing protein
MHVAHRLGLFSLELGRELLASKHERVLAHTLRLIRENALVTPLASELIDLSNHASTRVRLELAMAASDLDSADRQPLLTRLFIHAREPMVQAILVAAAGESSWQLFDRSASEMSAQTRDSWLALLLPQWSQQIGRDPVLTAGVVERIRAATEGQDFAWIRALSNMSDPSHAARILDALTAAERQDLEATIERQIETALAEQSTSQARFRPVRLLNPDAQSAIAVGLLAPTNSEAAQLAALDLITWRPDPLLAKQLMRSFDSLTPTLQAVCLRALVGRRETAEVLVDAVEQQKIRASQVPLDIREQLFRVADPQIASRIKKFFTSVSADRQTVIDRYTPTVDAAVSSTEPILGQTVFQKNCEQCHRLGQIGNDVGPPLRQLADKSAQQLLETILDPNREIDPRYVSYSILLEDGRVLAGIIEDETADQLVLKEAGGKQHVIHRADIEQIKNNGVSLMPVGLEENISPQQMSQLIQYLQSKSTGLP